MWVKLFMTARDLVLTVKMIIAEKVNYRSRDGYIDVLREILLVNSGKEQE